jgi:ectoine hydroxylase-related dioxygenase (phytanoyl-CoA dioxygenase family)
MQASNDLLGARDRLAERLRETGYLLFRDILPPEPLRGLREQITAVLAEVGWIADGEERDQAIVRTTPHREGEPGFFDAYDPIMHLEAFHSLPHRRELMALMREVLGDSVFPHPLGVCRLVFPDYPEISTPPHQDYRNNQGTVNLTAAWIPLGDCRRADGGLAVLEGSNRAGLLPLQFSLGPGNRGAILSEDLQQLRWVSTDFRLGDVLLFPALTVHSALHNQAGRSMRLSVDFRYQLEGEALTPACLEPHFGRFSWEEIYRGWQSADLQYYWRNRRFMTVPWDTTMHQLPRELAQGSRERREAFEKRRAQQRQALADDAD